MPAPLLIQFGETPFSTLSPRTVTATDTFTSDVIVAYAITEESLGTSTITNSGAALTWTLEEEVSVSLYSWLGVWTTVLPDNRPTLDITFTRQGASYYFGGGAALFRSSDGVGASAQNHANSAAPSCNITTTGDLSTIFVVNVDYDLNDGDSRVWRTTADNLIELTYYFNSLHETYYVGYHPDTGVAAVQNVGLTTPSNQKYSTVAVEVLAGEPRDVVPGELIHMKAR